MSQTFNERNDTMFTQKWRKELAKMKLEKLHERDRAHMEKDHQMLNSLERNIASMQVGKAGSYSALLGESVALKKKASNMAQTARALGDESSHLQQQATADVGKATKEQAGPDKLHGEAHALRLRYGAQMAKMSLLEKELRASRPASKPAEKAAHKASLSGAVSATPAALTGAGSGKGAAKAGGSSALSQAESKGKARQQFLAGLFSRSWNKVKPGQDRATE